MYRLSIDKRNQYLSIIEEVVRVIQTLSINNDNKYKDIHVLVKRDNYLTPNRKMFGLNLIDRSGPKIAISRFDLDNQEQMELFKMLLSKYVYLCNEGSESMTFTIPQKPISDKMEPIAKELKEKLEVKIGSDDSSLRRIKQLISNVIEDIESQLKTLEDKKKDSYP